MIGRDLSDLKRLLAGSLDPSQLSLYPAVLPVVALERTQRNLFATFQANVVGAALNDVLQQQIIPTDGWYQIFAVAVNSWTGAYAAPRTIAFQITGDAAATTIDANEHGTLSAAGSEYKSMLNGAVVFLRANQVLRWIAAIAFGATESCWVTITTIKLYG